MSDVIARNAEQQIFSFSPGVSRKLQTSGTNNWSLHKKQWRAVLPQKIQRLVECTTRNAISWGIDRDMLCDLQQCCEQPMYQKCLDVCVKWPLAPCMWLCDVRCLIVAWSLGLYKFCEGVFVLSSCKKFFQLNQLQTDFKPWGHASSSIFGRGTTSCISQHYHFLCIPIFTASEGDKCKLS